MAVGTIAASFTIATGACLVWAHERFRGRGPFRTRRPAGLSWPGAGKTAAVGVYLSMLAWSAWLATR
jgi:hypothetical protein